MMRRLANLLKLLFCWILSLKNLLLILAIFIANKASLALMEGAGFKLEGIKCEAYFDGEEYLGILVKDWDPCTKPNHVKFVLDWLIRPTF